MEPIRVKDDLKKGTRNVKKMIHRKVGQHKSKNVHKDLNVDVNLDLLLGVFFYKGCFPNMLQNKWLNNKLDKKNAKKINSIFFHLKMVTEGLEVNRYGK